MGPEKGTASAALAVLSAASDVLAADQAASIDAISAAAGVSRATFYRHFRSRAALLAALDIQPDPDTRERILAAAAELIGRDGLRGLSMGGLAARAGRPAPGHPRQMHPTTAAQLFMAPIAFHLVTRHELDRLGLARDVPV